MKLETAKVISARAGLTLLVLAVLWILPPAIHNALHYCPVGPDGLSQAEAVPAFARKYGFSCIQCHTSFPTLNEFGRQFKLNGYVPERGSDQGALKNSDGSFWTEKNFPWSVVVRSRPYDKTQKVDTEFRFQPLQDVDFFIAGGDAAKNISYLGEIDANSAGGFTPSMGDIQLGYHHNEYLNVIGARRGFFVMDPYQTLSNFGSPSLGARATAGTQIADLPLAPETLDQTTQTGYVYGEAGKDSLGYLYYAGGVSANKGNDQGSGPKAGDLRLAFDTLKGLVIGTFGSFGHTAAAPLGSTTSPADRIQFEKTGIDMLIEKGGLAVRSAFLYDHDRDEKDVNKLGTPTLGFKETNRAAYAELMYIYKRSQDKIPFLVPLVRQNWYTAVNGAHQFSFITAQLAHYFQPNVKAFVEYTADTKQDIQGSNTIRSPKGSRWTGQIEVGF